MCLYFLYCSPPMLLLGSITAFARADVPPNGLSDSEILALVAGSALPENIVNQIQRRGSRSRSLRQCKGYKFCGVFPKQTRRRVSAAPRTGCRSNAE